MRISLDLKRALIGSLCIFLPSCMVGPNYHTPLPPMPCAYVEDRRVNEEPISYEDLAHWWTLFNDPFLNELLCEALQGSFDLKIAVEQICQARAALWVQVASLLPELDSDAQATRSRTSQTLTRTSFFEIPPIQNFYQANLDVLWEIDIFGGLRRAAQAAYFSLQATAENARNVRIILLSEVATTYTTICALQKTCAIAAQIVRLDEDLVDFASDRFDAGLTNEQEVAAAIATLENDCANLKTIETALRQAIYSLAILLGKPPETLLEPFSICRPIPYAAGKIPCGLPADLLRRRPDIRSAERDIAAATAEIGVAVANLFPKFNLTGSSSSFSSNPLQGANYGYASNVFSKLFTAPSRIWGLGVLATLPLFDFGKRLAMVKEQVSLEHQAFFTYEKTVIAALQEVESDFVAYFNEEERLQCLTREVEADQREFDLTCTLFKAGLANYTQVLDAEEILLEALANQVQSQQALTNDLIALYKALGGGWECCCTP